MSLFFPPLFSSPPLPSVNTQKNSKSRNRKKQSNNRILACFKRRVAPDGNESSNHSNFNSGVTNSRHALASNVIIGGEYTAPSAQTANDCTVDTNLQYNRHSSFHPSKLPAAKSAGSGEVEEIGEAELVIEPEKIYSFSESDDKDRESSESNFEKGLPDSFPVLQAVRMASRSYLPREEQPDCHIEDV